MTDWLANISLEYVIAAVVVLLIARLLFGKGKSATAKSAAEIAESALIAIVLVFLIIRPFVVQAFYIPSGSMRPTLLEQDHILVNKFVYRFKEPNYGDIVVFKSPPEATNPQYVMDGAEWNKVVGEVVAPVGDEGAVKVRTKTPDKIGRVDEIFVTGKNGRGQLMSIEKLYADDGDVIVKFSDADNAESAESLTGAELRISEKDYIKRLIARAGDIIEVREGEGVFRNGELLTEPYIMDIPQYDYGPIKVPEGMVFVMGDNRNNSNDSHEWGPLEQERVIGKALFRFWPLYRIGLVR